MKPPQAWQAALGQLHLEMPKAAFDTWVRDAEFISFNDDTFTIGVYDAYAQDWLTDRLTSTIKKLLTGIMNQAVEVHFEVCENPDEAKSEENSELTEVEAVFDLPYDEIVGTGIIAIPAYFGRYHLPELGPNLAWMVVGFRQAAYMSGQRSGSHKQRISERQIARWSGMYRSTFQRRKQKTETWEKLQGFVNLVDNKPSWAAVKGEMPRKRAHAYQVQMTMPLSAAHACSLKQWFAENIEAVGSPKAVLELALTLSLKDLLPEDAIAPDTEIRKSIVQIVMECFAKQLPDTELISFAQRLQHHIMPPNDQIIITHFFVKNLLSLLGPGPSWMLTLLRDRCYLNRETGEQRNEVIVKDGWSEIAGWMGLKQSMTIWRWLHGTKRNCKQGSEAKVPPLSVFVHEVETTERASSFESGERTFHIALEDLPLTIIDELGDYSPDMNWRVTIKEIFARIGPMDTHSRKCVQCNRAFASNGIARLRPDLRANASNVVARSRPNLRANASNLSSLIPSLKHLNTLDTPYLPTRDIESGKWPDQHPVMGAVGKWDWDFLFSLNPEVNPKDQAWLLENAEPEAFVSWMIYAFSHKGQGIKAPVMFVISRLRENPDRGPGAEFTTYINTTPRDLHGMLEFVVENAPWEEYLPKDDSQRIELRKCLFGH